jgi:FkbM family methyltransferase
MALPSTLAQQLALLGVHLPTWPEENTDQWSELGKSYAEGVRFWRAHLQNASPSERRVVGHFLSHLKCQEEINPWDQWLASTIFHDVSDPFDLDRWNESIRLILSIPLSPAQLFGASLSLAEAHQLSGAIKGIQRLLSNAFLTGETALAICSSFVAAADTSWLLSEANHSSEAWQKALEIHFEWLCLLQGALEWSTSNVPQVIDVSRTAVMNSLDRSLSLLGDEDGWAMLPFSQVRKLLLGGDCDSAIELLQSSFPASLPMARRKATARLFASQLLAREGKWQDATALHEAGVSELMNDETTNNVHQAQLEILRSETNLLSHELSIALQAGTLNLAQPSVSSSDIQVYAESKDYWQSRSRSQLGQDLWVLEKLNWKQGGFFVEFGATDGVLLSNTWLLEKSFQWQGICAEPNPKFFEQLRRNRTCHLSSACVHRASGEKMRFVLADVYGGLADYAKDDEHFAKRVAYEENGEVMEVETISLMDLLDQYNAPRKIDYLSIDTEGSEFTILEGIDWERYRFSCITVEHNFAAQRQQISTLLLANGYVQHEAQWDDWYFKPFD